ncbi:hypothetical protein ME1_00442 [Bartonella vinsonii subsp. arupensis OK-94-513]|uniref:Uncharacterized protein n=2 Tax=Bartonella vinsonii subsp. arupensis TaxID=110578 RepID=J1JXB2_BARVI|nr:hypothetical protein [Bartonella vinsonii]EJF89672.1 hypothetical protein ME1_00442 [Bartonella vinsonii subsp. arupensis OK-94-513]EJF98323.1 hypothetical protein MEI_00822 [Bartonella vinsonii subsp. arupensis Pm136co]
MTISNFITLATVCASSVHPAAFSTVAMQEPLGDICAINARDELLHQSFRFRETIAANEQLKKNGHDFDISLEQIDVQNLKWFHVSRSSTYNSCKDLKIVQTTLTGLYKKTILRAVLSFYKPKSFENDFIDTSVRKVGSHITMETSALSSDKSQEPVQLHTEESDQTVETEALPSSSEELVDAFAHKVSSARDVFTAEDASFRKQQE